MYHVLCTMYYITEDTQKHSQTDNLTDCNNLAWQD